MQRSSSSPVIPSWHQSYYHTGWTVILLTWHRILMDGQCARLFLGFLMYSECYRPSRSCRCRCHRSYFPVCFNFQRIRVGAPAVTNHAREAEVLANYSNGESSLNHRRENRQASNAPSARDVWYCRRRQVCSLSTSHWWDETCSSECLCSVYWVRPICSISEEYLI